MRHTPHISRSSPKAEGSLFREYERFAEETGGKRWWLEAKKGSPALTASKAVQSHAHGRRLESIMASDSNLDRRVPLRVSNQRAYVWDVEGTFNLELHIFAG